MVFPEVIQKLANLGFYDFVLPFIIVAALLYAILRKTKVLGESPLINGIVSVAVSFFILLVPALAGVSLVAPLTGFFGQTIIVILIIAFGLLVTGLFVPNLMEKMTEWIKGGWIMWAVIIVVLLVAISSGLFSFITEPIKNALGSRWDTFIVIIIVLIAIGIIAAVSGRGK